MGARLRCLTTALVLVLPLCASAAADDPLPDAATILAKVKAASELPTAWRRTTETVVSNGSVTRLRYAQYGDDWREVQEGRRFHEEQGQVDGHLWHQNANGQTVLDQPDPGVAEAEHITTTVTHVTRPIDALVVADLNVRGFGTRRFIDPKTWQVVRRETVTANGAVATTYDDFRPEGARVFAHHWSVVDGYARTTSETRVVEFAAGASKADVAMAPPRRRLVEFPAGKTRVTLPTQFAQNQVFVAVTINGRRLDFVLDTGAGGITLDRDVARQLGLASYDQRSAVAAQRYTTAESVVPEMRIGDLVMHDVAVGLVPQGFEEAYGVKTVGLLGFDFLAELGVTIDYERQHVTVEPEALYLPPDGKHVYPLDVRIGDGSPYLVVSINGIVAERFLIDTGGAGALMIMDGFARKHPDAFKKLTPADDAELYGIGGRFKTRAYVFPSVKMGNITFQKFVGYVVSSANSYQGDDDGLIAPEFLKYFTVGLHYGESRIYLVPNRLGREAMGFRD